MLKSLSVEKFLDEVASSSPAPGGGSVAALAGAQGAGLLSMYCNLSINRKKYAENAVLLEDTGNKARKAMAELTDIISEDTEAFNSVMAAYRLPKDSEPEMEKRKEAIQSAAMNAAEVPLTAAQISLELLSFIDKVAGKGNTAAVTDLGVANLQIWSALQGASYNSLINLGMINDSKVVAELHVKTGQILEQGKVLFEKNRIYIEKEIKLETGL